MPVAVPEITPVDAFKLKLFPRLGEMATLVTDDASVGARLTTDPVESVKGDPAKETEGRATICKEKVVVAVAPATFTAVSVYVVLDNVPEAVPEIAPVDASKLKLFPRAGEMLTELTEDPRLGLSAIVSPVENTNGLPASEIVGAAMISRLNVVETPWPVAFKALSV